MSASRSFSRSFSSGSLVISNNQNPKKRKNSEEPRAPRRRPRPPRFKRADGEDDIDGGFCSRCRKIPFEAILEMEPDETVTDHGVNVWDLGPIAPFSKDVACELCVFFALILSRNQEYDPPWEGGWYLRAFTTGTLRNRTHAAASRAQDLSIVIALSMKSDTPNKDEKIECIDRGVIMPWDNVLDPDSSNLTPCHIIPCLKRVGFDCLKDMLSSCDTKHVRCKERREKSVPFPVRARVIDCHARNVVPLTAESPYLALSYVWGPRKPEDLLFRLDQDTELPDELPATIEDAISFTTALGYQYLWVDRYCVDQSQSDDTRHQIAQMGSIYSHAYLTICALGEHDEVGLPGVSLPRRKQIRVQTQGLILSWTGPSIRRYLEFSQWRHRGWTYQESVLSQRCLFFTHHFAALSCDSETSTENIFSSYFYTWYFNKEAELYGDAASWGQVLFPAQEFDKHLQEFQRRRLSYVRDTLNAFKGILSQLSVQSYWGIPIYRTVLDKSKDLPELCGREKETGFITGLCWRVKQSSHTDAPDREDLPSWSWVGQKYARMFANCLVVRPHELKVPQPYFALFQASIRVKCAEDNWISLQELSETHTTSRIIPEQTRFLEVRSVKIRWTPQLNPQKKSGWIEGGLDANQAGWNGWWPSDFIGDLHLDPSYDELTKSHDKCIGEKRPCKHLPLNCDTAILLALDARHSGNRALIRAVWLVVKQIKGGTYRRKGIIASDYAAESSTPLLAPTGDMLENFILG